MPTTNYDPEEVARRVEDGDAEDLFVLDVRAEDDYEEWRIPGSENVPVYDDLLDYDFSSLEAHLDAVPEHEEVAVVCVAGVTSARAAEFLREQGYDAESVDDGMRGWGRVHRDYDLDADSAVQVVRPGTGCVSHLLHDDGEALVVDPSQYVTEYLALADDRDLEIVGVLDTHAHADHVSGARRLAGELDAPYYLHAADVGELEAVTELAGGDAISVGERSAEVSHTPGHTPGSVSLHWGDALLTGDTLFLRGVGRPDLEGGGEEAVREAAGRLFGSLDELTDAADEMTVLPSHFDDETARPLATDLHARLRAAENDLLECVAADERAAFVDAVVESLAEEPANYNEMKEINQGREQPGGDVESLELGPNNCAAN